MPDNDIPIGQLFTHVYCDRSKPANDSNIFRNRIGAYCGELAHDRADRDETYRLYLFIKKEMGFSVSGYGTVEGFEMFFRGIELRYMLNAVTQVWRFYNSEPLLRSRAHSWHNFVSRALREENMGYRLDEKCGVHFLVDEEFERSRASVLTCLQGTEYKGVLDAFEKAHEYLENQPPDTKAAARSVFECLEILVKQIVTTPRLNSKIVKEKIKPIVLACYEGDKTAEIVSARMCESFADWVDGMQNYRHGQNEPEPVAPPIGLAIQIMSSGASFLRWLVEIHKAQTPS